MVASSLLYPDSFVGYTVHTDSHDFTCTKKPLYPVGTAVEEAEMKVWTLTSAHAQLTYNLQPELWPKVTV